MHAHAMPNWFAMAGQRGRGRPHRRPHGGHGFGPPFGPGFGGFGPRGPRARRGDVRAALLVLLAEEPRNGYQLMEEIESRSGGAWRPSPGSVYPALAQLEDEALIRSDESAGRRSFELTDEGRTYVADNREALGSPWDEAGDGVPTEFAELRSLIGRASCRERVLDHV